MLGYYRIALLGPENPIKFLRMGVITSRWVFCPLLLLRSVLLGSVGIGFGFQLQKDFSFLESIVPLVWIGRGRPTCGRPPQVGPDLLHDTYAAQDLNFWQSQVVNGSLVSELPRISGKGVMDTWTELSKGKHSPFPMGPSGTQSRITNQVGCAHGISSLATREHWSLRGNMSAQEWTP